MPNMILMVENQQRGAMAAECRYLSQYGFHFSEKAYKYACSEMAKRNRITGLIEKVEPYSKAEVDALLERYNIALENKTLYDYVYVAAMAKADYWGSSITEEAKLAQFIKDYVDDVDASDETTFRRWLATEVGNGTPVDFYELLENE